MNGLIEQWQDRVRQAAATGGALRLQGGGSKLFYGRRVAGELFETSAWRGVVRYEPTELVITARCGTPLAEIEQVLAERGQMLAFEPPHFGAATLGGMLAAGLSGPRRAAAGAVRDHVLGVRLLDGRGELLRFGGEVMKNVAGYDVSRLMVGALGTLGLILEASLKVLPRPAAERTQRLAMGQDEALRTMNRWGGQALPISATCWCEDVLHVRLSGAAAAVDAAAARIGGEALEAGAGSRLWLSVREQTHPFFQGEAGLWRVSLPSNAGPMQAGSATLIEWGGALRWVRHLAEDESVRKAAWPLNGTASLFRAGGTSSLQPFEALSPPLAALHRRLKEAFDPAGVFNRARMYADW